MDVAASEFFKDNLYDLDFKNPNSTNKIPGSELMGLYSKWCNEYPLVTIEDPFDQDDWESYAAMTQAIGTQVQIVGDDLLVTNPKRIQKALETKACNALLLKVN